MASPSVIQSSLADYFRMTVQKEVDELVEPLSSEQIWERPFPYGNSIGKLILHLTGNLNYYIGTQIGGTGYIRHRDLEFNDSGKRKEDVLKAFDGAIVMVVRAVSAQSDADWSAPYQAERADASTRFGQIQVRDGQDLLELFSRIKRRRRPCGNGRRVEIRGRKRGTHQEYFEMTL